MNKTLDPAVYRFQGRYLVRDGADDGCIWCGLPDGFGFLNWAHIHPQDRRLAPKRDLRRAFRLRWIHHHGFYDQGYITIEELLKAEEIWIAGHQPKPHRRDLALIRAVKAGERKRRNRHQEPAGHPKTPSTDPGTVRALKARCTTWVNRANDRELSPAERSRATG